MPTLSLSEIEAKIAALRQRYTELDGKLVPKRGIVDGSVSAAMGAITSEISRLDGLREKALVSDLLGEKSEEPKQLSSAPRVGPIPMPVYATKNESLSNPLEGLARLPESEEEQKRLYQELAAWSLEQVNSDLERRQKEAAQDIDVRFTQSFFKSLIVTLGMLAAEMRLLVAMGRENRKELEQRLLKRIEALEARPVMVDAGVWDETKSYGPGSFVSHQGCGWVAQVESKGIRPGDGTIWRLAVKKGRDGRDARDAR